MSKTVEQIRGEILANKKPEACETYQNANGICSKCGHEKEAHTPHSERQARAQLSSICEMVANLTEEGAAKIYADALTEDERRKYLTDNDVTFDPELDDSTEMLVNLIVDGAIAPPDFEWDEERARETIQEDALEVQVRGDWHSPGDEDGGKPSEFYILLCTGGPAVRIMGELDEHMQPSRAWIEHQDWFKPWTHLCGLDSDQVSALLTYCQQFYFGE